MEREKRTKKLNPKEMLKTTKNKLLFLNTVRI